MKISMIAAIGKNYELGLNNDLIWKLKGDLQFFKKTTLGHPVVMGRKTFESLPKVLPGRKNIVISRSEILNKEIKVYKGIKEFLLENENIDDEYFIIGGATIYKSFIDLATKLYLTEIDAAENKAEVYFPKFDKSEWNKEILGCNKEGNIYYTHALYRRK